MDCGATDSFLGKGSLKFLNENKLKYHRLGTFVRTADGIPNKVEGYIFLKFIYDKNEREIRFLIVPSLENEIYLGMNFWAAYKIFPAIIASIANSDKNAEESNLHILNEEQRLKLENVKELIPSFKRIGLGRTKLHEFEIKVKPDTLVIKQKFYPISSAVQEKVYAVLDSMLEKNIIEVSHSSYSSLVTLVKKSDGSIRFCVDARKINEATIFDAYPTPRMDGLLGWMKATKFISALDLKDAF